MQLLKSGRCNPRGSPYYGSGHHKAKLSESDVIEIVYLRRVQLWTYQSIADTYGVSYKTIYQINAGEIWGHTTGIDRQGNLTELVKPKSIKLWPVSKIQRSTKV